MLDNLSKKQNFTLRSISPENFEGVKSGGARALEGTGKEAARDLGVGWKVSPSIMVQPQSNRVIAKINHSGKIRHIWMTCFPAHWRELILDFYWDGSLEPSISVPYGDFFCNGWCERSNVNSLPVVVNPAGGMNCYWEMPFKKSAEIRIRNIGNDEFPLYYQIDYSQEKIDDDICYFCAKWNRSNPLEYKKMHTILDKISGSGHYVGTYMAYQTNNNRWWGEGELKVYLDGDDEYPTICGTGTEDYFGGAWDFEQPKGEYCYYSTPYTGLSQIIKPDGLYLSQQRFGMYRWHLVDPFVFTQDISVKIQALGWRSEGRYLPLQDDIASVAFFYLDHPDFGNKLLDNHDELEVI
ncbi:glycoside hydrolase family 172 protein [Enterococcus massiliensis]|uniref:glycoside hydrolase family 172 protein n=1 Tax=Enterococcus massiliensis TaxID=1640685 RepID=UPI00065E2C2F|nr:glycoside hydrolase family 172 protein [Enterococcus massiliensis]